MVSGELEPVTCHASECPSLQIVEHHEGEDRDAKRARILALAGWQLNEGGWICAHHVLEPAAAPVVRKRPRLVDTATAGLLAGKAPSTIRRWATKEGRLCAYGTKQRLLVDMDEVVELCRLLERKPPLSERSERAKMPT
ncbi:hypothetical protein [Streptomyces sp. NPDC093261]|uniref:hypothetical protein n=1 Tax=Streptomyces sp. NPDC093261 TaxID=3366037 RepID=UPI0038294C6E